MLTTFIVDPESDECRVTIRTEIEASAMSAFFQRLIVPRILRRIFRDELRNIEREATRKKPGFS